MYEALFRIYFLWTCCTVVFEELPVQSMKFCVNWRLEIERHHTFWKYSVMFLLLICFVWICETEFTIHRTVNYNFTEMWTWKYVFFFCFVFSRKVQRNEEINEIDVPTNRRKFRQISQESREPNIWTNELDFMQ